MWLAASVNYVVADVNRLTKESSSRGWGVSNDARAAAADAVYTDKYVQMSEQPSKFSVADMMAREFDRVETNRTPQRGSGSSMLTGRTAESARKSGMDDNSTGGDRSFGTNNSGIGRVGSLESIPTTPGRELGLGALE